MKVEMDFDVALVACVIAVGVYKTVEVMHQHETYNACIDKYHLDDCEILNPKGSNKSKKSE